MIVLLHSVMVYGLEKLLVIQCLVCRYDRIYSLKRAKDCTHEV